MARNYTSINHCALSSDTLAEANDATQALFWRLLCVSDDWGRFPNSPAKLKRMMQDFSHTKDQIAEAVKHFIGHGSISVYEIEGVSICEWNKWDEYQTMRWKNEAEMPNREGVFEASTNPLSDRPSKKKPNISYPIKADDDAFVTTKAEAKAQHKTVHKLQSKPDDLGDLLGIISGRIAYAIGSLQASEIIDLESRLGSSIAISEFEKCVEWYDGKNQTPRIPQIINWLDRSLVERSPKPQKEFIPSVIDPVAIDPFSKESLAIKKARAEKSGSDKI